MALRGNRPDFFAGVGRWGCGFPADAGTFTPAAFCGGWRWGGSRRMRRFFLFAALFNGTRLSAQIASFFAGLVAGGWVPGGCEGFFFLRRRCNGTRLPAQITGFFAGVGGGGCGFPADAKDFPFCSAVVTGQGSRRKLPGFFAGLAGGGTKLLQRAGLRRKGADDCGFYARRRGWRFCGGRRAGHFYDSITKAAVALLFGGCGVIII